MSRNLMIETELPLILRHLATSGEEAPTLDEKLEIVRQFRGRSPESSAAFDQQSVAEMCRLRAGLDEARKTQKGLKTLLEKATAPPWHPALYLGPAMTKAGPGAVVVHGSTRRVVTLADGLAADALVPGDGVLLSAELNAILAKSPDTFQVGEVATFDRYTGDGRIVLVSRDEESIVAAAGPLRDTPLRSGDLVRWDRPSWMAFERVEKSESRDLFLEETPSERFEDIGGLDDQIEELQRTVLLPLRHPDLVRKYGLRPKRSVLLWGSPGTGKTMMARALANRLRDWMPGPARFMNIKPSGFNSMWFGESERRVRQAFAVAREASEDQSGGVVVMYFDEVDGLGAARGAHAHQVDDKVLNAFMSELDGLESRGNVLVVASTNRRDALDPALTRLGRLGDCPIHVPMPNRRAAAAIFRKHLKVEIPYAGNGHPPDVTREEIIESVVSRIYAPNAESELAEIMFRDGRRRTVRSAEMTSGAVIARLALVAAERALVRELETGQAGVRLDDLLWAMNDEFSSAARLLTPRNCHAYLADLPDDVDVVSVRPIVRRASEPQRYMTA